MGKEDVLAILDEVSRTYRGEYTELMTHLMKDMVEEIYEAAENFIEKLLRRRGRV
jgi:hypothetical protein